MSWDVASLRKWAEEINELRPNYKLDDISASEIMELADKLELLERDRDSWKRMAELCNERCNSLMGPCKCTFAQRMTGDGCEICNPWQTIEYLKERLADLER